MPRATMLGGVAMVVTATLFWGALLPIGKTILPALGPFYLTSIRYGFAGLVFLAILLLVEGRGSLQYSGRFLQAVAAGTVGITCYNLLTFAGLRTTSPQDGSLIGSLLPLMTAAYLWARVGRRPSGSSMVLLGIALCGVGLVITNGDLASLTDGGISSGVGLMVIGTAGWMLYTLSASRFPGWSPLRYTALTVVPGAISAWIITLAATAIGLTSAPAATTVWHDTPQLLYMSTCAGVTAVLFWNIGVRRLGAQNGTLFINLTPMVTLIVQAARGDAVTGVQVLGCAITVGALIANNLLGRGSPSDALAVAEPAGTAPVAAEFEVA